MALPTIYLDHAATTSMLPCALERLQELSAQVMGNASSVHRRGKQAKEVLDRCHESLGHLFDVPPSHVLFTSGGTESTNLAVWGALGGLEKAFDWIQAPRNERLLTSVIEHEATANLFKTLEKLKAPVT